MRLLAGSLVYFYLGWIVCSVASKTNLRRWLDPGPGEAVGNSSVRLIPQLDDSSESAAQLDLVDSRLEEQQEPDQSSTTNANASASASSEDDLRRQLGLNQGESNVHISGSPLRMRDTSKYSSLWLVPIRFVGPTAFSPKANPVGALRCELFSRLTLKSLVWAISPPPPRTRIEIILINQTAILEPTCAKVITRAQKLLKNQLHFAPDTESYLQLFAPLKEDVLFITRFDSDDAVGPRVFIETHAAFMKTKFPLAIISPFYGNLWYPFAGDGSCGQMIYNALVRKFPIFQTNAYDLAQLKEIVRPKTTMVDFFTSEEGNYYMPMHYDHKDPEQYFRKFREQFKRNLPPNWLCGMNNLQHYSSDCLLFFFSWSSDGIPGVIYTQTGLQSSLARAGHIDVDTLKYHRHYDASLEKTSPDVCAKGLAYFNVDKQEIAELREQYVRDMPKYAGHMEDVFVVKGSHVKGEGDGEGEEQK